MKKLILQKELADEKINSEMKKVIRVIDILQKELACKEKIDISQKELVDEKINSEMKVKLLESYNEKIDILQKGLANEKLNSEMKTKSLESCKEKIDISQKELADEKINSEMKVKLLESCDEKIDVLQKELANEKLNSEMKIKLLKSCNGNFESATTNLLVTTKQLQSCMTSGKEFVFTALQAEKINLICEGINEEQTCNAVSLKVESSNSIVQDVIDREGNKIHANKTKELNILNQQTLFLPLLFAQWFPNLINLSVIESGLYSIELNVLKHLTNLISLNLTYNKILAIPSDAFNDLKNLEQLDLSSNKLNFLENGVFKSLTKLEFLDLSSNKLMKIKFETFETLKNLIQLFLQNNELKYISANLLTPLINIRIVDFTNNVCISMSHPTNTLKGLETKFIDNCTAQIDLYCIYEGQFDAEPKIKKVCKAKDLIVDYPKTKVSSLGGVDSNIHVTILKIQDQSTKYFPINLAERLPNIIKIIVERSKLTSILKEDFAGFLKLKTIEIRYNNLSTIQEGSFDDIIQLEHLDLSFNNIASLPSKIFLRLVHLKTLILSNNQLVMLSADILPRKNVIEEFRINNNQLKLIETKIMRLLQKSILIDLESNVCIDLKFHKNLQGSKTIVELSGEIDLYCSVDEPSSEELKDIIFFPLD